MRLLLKEKMKEALSSVLPITLIVLLLSFTVAPLSSGTLVLFLLGAALLIVGMGFFSLGADLSMMPMGNETGRKLSGWKRPGWMLFACFLIGTAITVAEPDLQVLARQVPAVPDLVIVLTVAVGVGLFLAIAMLREMLGLSLRTLLLICYPALFLLSTLVPNEFLAVAFDSGGVTTGPITVPFVMALGIGIASMKRDGSEESNFGLVALSSIGPILAVMLMGLVMQSTRVVYEPFQIPQVPDSQEAGRQFAAGLPVYLREVAAGLFPIMALFALLQLGSRGRMGRRSWIKILIGTAYTYVGLALFLTGVNVGFMPVGNALGAQIGGMEQSWILLPLGVLIGYFIVVAEPAVHVLNKQVEELTNGAVPGRAMLIALSAGVGISVGLSMIRVLTGISIYWFLAPGYALALGMSFFVPPVFTAIAFDSGGVASGPMTATFLLPFTMGACEALGGNVLTDAFGVIAMVAMTPLVAIQLLGLVYNRKLKTATDITPAELGYITDEIIDYEEAGWYGGAGIRAD